MLQEVASLEYCSIMWGYASPITLSLFFSIQRRPFRLKDNTAPSTKIRRTRAYWRAVGDFCLYYGERWGFLLYYLRNPGSLFNPLFKEYLDGGTYFFSFTSLPLIFQISRNESHPIASSDNYGELVNVHFPEIWLRPTLNNEDEKIYLNIQIRCSPKSAMHNMLAN